MNRIVVEAARELVEHSFFHITHRKNIASILKHGLDPGKTDKGMIYLSPDLGHVQAYAGTHFEESDTSTSVVLEIDPSALDDTLLGPDDDDLQDILEQNGDERDWEDVSWEESIKITNQCTYRGKIPPRAIKVLTA